MPQPFRETPVCPQCANASLREFNKRLVCDKCEGMLIGVEDFAASIHELDGGTEPIELRDLKPDKAGCPRCGQPMQSCTAHVGPNALGGRMLRCEADGVWISHEAMVAVYARISRSAHAGGGGLSANAAAAYLSVAPTGSGTGAMRGIAGAFRNRQRGAIDMRSKPITHTAFVSEFRGKELSCPKCKAALVFEGDRWDCKTCAGTFVEDAALTAMVSDILKTPWAMPLVAGNAGEAPCPACATAMTVERLASTTIDRCERHGVWFDEDELATVLLETTSEQEPHGIGAWIKRLFT